MERIRVLAVCIHNSARSQMTEEYLRKLGGEAVDVESAGLEPGEINPVVVELLKEDGIDITGKKTASVYDLHAAGKSFDYVIAVCDPESAERCPIFPAEKRRLHWPFADPSRAVGSFEEKTAYVRPIRDEIKQRVAEFVDSLLQDDSAG
ncbi:MAG: arsenate reductase ArsC [Spirochaetaceae bacterium]